MRECQAAGKPVDPGLCLFKVAKAAAVGYAVGTLPDLIDSPLSPRHRSVAHAVAPASLVLHWGWKQSLDPSLQPWVRELLQDAILGTASHLGADAFTPAGLNLLVRGF